MTAKETSRHLQTRHLLSLLQPEARRGAEDERAINDILWSAIDAAPLGIITLDRHAQVRSWSPGAERIFGYRAEEVLGQKPPVIPEHKAEEFQNIHETTLRGTSLAGIEVRRQRKNGSPVDLNVWTSPICDAAGDALGHVALVADVSERKAMERELRRQKDLLSQILDVLPVGVWVTDKEGRIVLGNRAGQRIWGGARYVGVEQYGEYVGWWADTGKPIAAEEWGLARAIRKGETSIGELVRIRCFDGVTYRTVRNSALPLRDEAGHILGAIVVNEDITALRETEDALRRAAELREELVAVVSHDLRSPLAAIRMALEMLQRSLPEDEAGSQARGYVERIERVLGRMNWLIEDLLELGRIEAGRIVLDKRSHQALGLVHDVIDLLAPLAKEQGVHLSIAPHSVDAAIVGDRDRLMQVLSNLVGNAIKFTPANGRVTVRVRCDDDSAEISVEDTGPGIPKEVRAHLFERYWSGAEGRANGKGIGLFIAKGIVDAHGGHIWVEDAPGGGARFVFTLPCRSPKDDPAGSVGASP